MIFDQSKPVTYSELVAMLREAAMLERPDRTEKLEDDLMEAAAVAIDELLHQIMNQKEETANEQQQQTEQT